MAKKRKPLKQNKSFSEQISDLASQAAEAGVFGTRRQEVEKIKKRRRARR